MEPYFKYLQITNLIVFHLKLFTDIFAHYQIHLVLKV